jgi:hypothetical protein
MFISAANTSFGSLDAKLGIGLFDFHKLIITKISVTQSSSQAPFTSENVGSILATDSCEKSQSTLCRKSWVFSGCSGFLPQGKLTGWVTGSTQLT